MDLFVGMVPPGPSGVRDHGHLLAEELGQRGIPVRERWVENEGRSLVGSLRAAGQLLRAGLRLRRGDRAVWHYASMSCGFRGIPLPGVLFGVAARLRGASVVGLLHEPTYPWGVRGWRGRVQSALHHAVLPLVVAGSSTVVVTTPVRARSLSRLARSVQVVPVFSTVPVVAGDGDGEDPSLVGVVAYAGDGALPEVVLDAIAGLADVRVLLIGGPGPDHRDAAHWRRLAAQRKLGERLSFTGVVPVEDLSRALQRCAVVMFANDEGPSGRRTTLAAALAHGRPVIAFDGPNTWPDLIEAGAVAVVPADPAALRGRLAALLADPAARRSLGDGARRFHEERLSLDRCAEAFADLLRAGR